MTGGFCGTAHEVLLLSWVVLHKTLVVDPNIYHILDAMGSVTVTLKQVPEHMLCHINSMASSPGFAVDFHLSDQWLVVFVEQLMMVWSDHELFCIKHWLLFLTSFNILCNKLDWHLHLDLLWFSTIWPMTGGFCGTAHVGLFGPWVVLHKTLVVVPIIFSINWCHEDPCWKSLLHHKLYWHLYLGLMWFPTIWLMTNGFCGTAHDDFF